MGSLHPVDWLICLVYFVVILAMGVYFARAQHDNEDYFVGGRRMHWLPIGLSVFAGHFSALSFVGLPAEGAYGDWHTLLGIMFIPLAACPIVAWLFVPLYHKLGEVSGYAYLERRFHRSVRLIGSLLYIGYAISWMGTMLVAVGVVLKVTLGLNDVQLGWMLVGVGVFATVYTTAGGVKAVVWTDVLQGLTLGGGMIAVLFLLVGKIEGGWSGMFQVAQGHDKFAAFDFTFDPTKKNFISACVFGFFVYLAGYAIQFKEIQRYISTPDIRSARRSLAVNGVMIALTCAVFMLMGTALFAYYHQGGAAQATADSAYATLDTDETRDELLPHVVINVLAVPGLLGILLAGLFAAAMSSIDSAINSLTATVVYDWLAGRAISLRVSRLLCALWGVGAVAVAILIHVVGKVGVFGMVIGLSGVWLGGLLGLFLLGMLVRWANTTGAIVGLLAGIACLFTAIATEAVHGWWYSVLMSMPTLIVGAAVSALTGGAHSSPPGRGRSAESAG